MMRFLIALLLIAAPGWAIEYRTTPVGTGILSTLHEVKVGQFRARQAWGAGNFVSLGDAYADQLDAVRASEGKAGLWIYDAATGMIRAPTTEERQEYRAQQEEARDPGGVERNRKAGLAAYLALESPTAAQTIAALKALIREVGAGP